MVDVFVNVISLAGENDGTSNDVRRAHTNLSRQIDLDVIEIGRGLHSLLFGSHWNDASFCGVHHVFAPVGHDHADRELPHVWHFSRFHWFSVYNDADFSWDISCCRWHGIVKFTPKRAHGACFISPFVRAAAGVFNAGLFAKVGSIFSRVHTIVIVEEVIQPRNSLFLTILASSDSFFWASSVSAGISSFTTCIKRSESVRTCVFNWLEWASFTDDNIGALFTGDVFSVAAAENLGKWRA